jgi:hypothetical protein entcl_0677
LDKTQVEWNAELDFSSFTKNSQILNKEIKMIQDELVNFLSRLDKKYVDSLIDVITGNGNRKIALDPAIKDFLVTEKNSDIAIHHRGTIKVLLNEFYQFGGNSIANIIRGFTDKLKSVDYDEILGDIYKRFISKNDKLSLKQKEEEILLLIFGKDWQKISFEDVKNISMKPNIKFGIYSDTTSQMAINTISKFSMLLLAKLNPAIAAGDSIRQISSPALRVVIPFMIQLIWLKNKFQNLITASSPPQPVKKYSEDVSTDEQESQKDSDISRVSQIFSNTTGVITSSELATGNYIQCTVSPELLAKVKDNPNLLRGVIVENGRLAEHAKFLKPKNLQKIVTSGVLFNVLSTIVAQKHLADISKKLSDIQNSIDQILKDIEFKEQSKINIAINNLAKISKTAYIKDNQEVSNRLCNDARNLAELSEALLLKIKDKINSIEYIDISDKKVKRNFIKLRELIDKYNSCIQVLSNIYTVLFYITQNEIFFQDIVGIKEEIKDFNVLLNKIYNTKFKRGLLPTNNRKLANEAFLENRKEEFECMYVNLENELKLVNRPYTLALAIENDEIIDCRLVEQQ